MWPATGDIAALIPLRCPFKLFTGWDCPTCGLGRSLIAAVLGRWEESWAYHPLGIPMLLLSIALIGGWIFQRQRTRALLAEAQAFVRRHRVLSLMLVLVYTVWGFSRTHMP